MKAKLALIGYGEVGRILAEDLSTAGHELFAFDLKLLSVDSTPLRNHASKFGVKLTESHAEAVNSCELVISAVTASQTEAAAEACSVALPPRCFFLDVNSASPATKIRAAALVQNGGARFIEGAIMTSVPPYRIKVPLLVGGPHALESVPMLQGFGFAVRVASEKLGVASATKMCRSVIVKGMEAMVIESLTAARHYGVEEKVLASLQETYPGIDWERQAGYFFQRVIEHGRRRSEEMHEVAVTVREAGLEPWSASGTAQRQAWVAELAARELFGQPGSDDFARSADWRIEADRILAHAGSATHFEKTSGWLDWCPQPSRPLFQLPPGAVDAHCHVFGPGAQFPYAPERKYTPCDAGKAELYALRDHLGFSRNVVVQASCHGSDNRAMADACRSSGGRARGVATLERSVSERELQDLHEAGVRGVRFNFLRRLVDVAPKDELLEIVERVRMLGWHVVVYFEAPDLTELWDFLSALPTTVVVDHMGRPDVSKPVDGLEFSLFVRLMREHPHVWTKVSCPERLSIAGPPAVDGERHAYQDVVPFARHLVETFPNRVLWGTDWPHPNLKHHMPDDGLLVDFIPRIAVTPELQHGLLVDNPMRLYWPEEC